MLNRYQQEIINTIMSDQILLKFLYYNKNEDILSKPDLSKKQAKQVREHNIYDFKKVPTLTDGDMITYISMEFDKISHLNGRSKPVKYWVSPTYVFYVINHYQNNETLNGSRINAIEDRIKELFHFKESISGLGSSFVKHSQPIYGLMHPYVGREIYIGFWDKNEGLWNG